MKKTILVALTLGATVSANSVMAAGMDPEQSRQQFVDYFKAKSPAIEFNDYGNGVYNYNADQMMQWKAAEEFPAYLDFIDAGEALWEKDQAVYENCFGNDVSKIRVQYPRFNEKTQQVETLEGQINQCRTDAKLEPFKWKKGDIANLSAFIAYQARGQKINVKIESEGAKKAFLAGQEYFVKPRGQFGLSCAECHVYNAGRRARGNTLGPALGHTSHVPIYRAKWKELGTLHRRYEGCDKNMRIVPAKAQSETYRNLEFFEAYMGNGIELNGPGYRE